MVSLINKLAVRSRYSDKPKIAKFTQLIEGIPNIETGESTNDTDRIYYQLIIALAKGNKVNFEQAYAEFSRRTPSSQSPWLYDNFMIFVLMLGICKYNIDSAWINNALLQRDNHNQSLQNINRTFRSLLIQNYQSLDNIVEIVVVFLNFLKLPQLSASVLDHTFQKLSRDSDLLQGQDDFLVIMSLRAHDVIVLTKDTPDAIEAVNLKKFRMLFLRRTDVIRDVIYFGLLTAMLVFALMYYRDHKWLKDFVDDLGAILQVIGIALFASFNKWIRRILKLGLLLIFGYRGTFKE